MKRLANITGYGSMPCIDLEGEGLINLLLTSELLDVIFATLRNLDLLSSNRVCRFWHQRTVAVAKDHCEKVEIMKMIDKAHTI